MRIDHRVARRFAAAMLFWRGHLQANEVRDFVGVSERTARSLLSHWRAGGLLPPYRRSGAERRLVPAEDFDPGPSVADPAIAFALLLTADYCPGNPFSAVVPPGSGHDLSLSAAVPVQPTRAIVGAYLDQETIRLIYAAKSGRQEFVFSPAALVRSRGRYHMRGYRSEGRDSFGDQLADRYVDIVPARAIEAWRGTAAFVGLDGDPDWHTFEERRFHLSRELSDDERLCYEHEYGIAETGVLTVKKRRALMPYVLQELQERRCWRRDGTSARIWSGAPARNSVP